MDLYLHFDRPLIEEELSKFRENIARRAKGEPLDYIIGEGDFFDCSLEITSDARIPRPETELLAEKIIQTNPKGKALDLCTGSGCLAVALKKHCPGLEVWAGDISEKALFLAMRNAKRNSVEIKCLQGDLFEPFSKMRFDLVVCNPPYVSAEEYAGLDPEVRNFEPKGALLGGVKGDEFYRQIASQIEEYLAPKAKVFFEIGATQGPAILEIFSHFPKAELLQDLAGLDRFVFLEFQ